MIHDPRLRPLATVAELVDFAAWLSPINRGSLFGQWYQLVFCGGRGALLEIDGSTRDARPAPEN